MKEKERSPGQLGNIFCLILLVVRSFGAVSAALENVQTGQGKLEETQWEKEPGLMKTWRQFQN